VWPPTGCPVLAFVWLGRALRASSKIAKGARSASAQPIRRFDVLFDHAEPSPLDDAAYAPYGNLGFPPPPAGRPWIYTNFVQSLDGITTLLGKHSSGGEISQSREDRWLMDLLRAHADGILMGMNTLREEQRQRGPDSRGIVFQVADPALRELRRKLGKGRERNIFVTSATTWTCRSARSSTAMSSMRQSSLRLRARSGCERRVDIRRLPLLPPETKRPSTCRGRFPTSAKSWVCSTCFAREAPHCMAA